MLLPVTTAVEKSPHATIQAECVSVGTTLTVCVVVACCPVEPNPSEPRNTHTANPQRMVAELLPIAIAPEPLVAAVAPAPRVQHELFELFTARDVKVRPVAVGTANVAAPSPTPTTPI